MHILGSQKCIYNTLLGTNTFLKRIIVPVTIIPLEEKETKARDEIEK